MKNIIFILIILLGANFSNLAYAVYTEASNRNTVWLMPGESKTVTLETFGAATASRVWIDNPQGVTANLVGMNELNPNQLNIRLAARNNSLGGNRVINLRLAAGVNRKFDVSVSSLPNATIDISGPGIAGTPQRIELRNLGNSFPLVASFNNTGKGVIMSGNAGFVDVVDTNNTSHNLDVIFAEGLILEAATRTVTVTFQRDTSIPTGLGAPIVIENPDGVIPVTVSRNASANSPRLRWKDVTDANGYVVQYQFSSGRIFEMNSINRTSTIILNRPTGVYRWRVKAVFEPGNGSILPVVSSDYSTWFQFEIKQNSTNEPAKPPFRRNFGTPIREIGS